MNETLILTSNASTVSDVTVPDMGLLVPSAGGSVTLLGKTDLNNAKVSNSLRTLSDDAAFGTDSHTLIINDGTANILPEDVDAFLSSLLSQGLVEAEKSNLELELEFIASQLTNFKELLYTGNQLTTVNIYEDNTKVVQIFGKTLSYTGNRLTQTILTRISDSATLTKDFAYSGSRLISITIT